MSNFNVGDKVHYVGPPLATISANRVGIICKVVDSECRIDFGNDSVTVASDKLRKITTQPRFWVGDEVIYTPSHATGVHAWQETVTIAVVKTNAGRFLYFTKLISGRGVHGPIDEDDLAHCNPASVMKKGDLAIYTGSPDFGLPRYAVVNVVSVEQQSPNSLAVVKFNDKIFSVRQSQLKPSPPRVHDPKSPEPMERRHEIYDLVPYQEISESFMRVAEYGAKKYDPWNWSKGNGLSRVKILGSLLRHTFHYLRGVDRDESGELHSDHILWNAVALVHNVHHGLHDGRRIEGVRDYSK